jgi:hypothetical protein
VRAGDVVWNPLTGEKALIVESGEARGFIPGGDD